MNCLLCKNKACKSKLKDCNGERDDTILDYKKNEIHDTYVNADKLVANGRAGSLSRLEEIAEFCRLEKFNKIGIAYCYGLEDLALDTMKYIQSSGLTTTSYRCTLGGIKENQIDDNLDDSVNCNPAGQARAIEKDGVDFVIEIGLCLGHDVIFHKSLKIPFTVFIVKDRVNNHNPALSLPNYVDENDKFIQSLDSSFNMRSAEWLHEKIENSEKIIILDVRTSEPFEKGHISGSINVPLKKLSKRHGNELKGHEDSDIICVCNGSVQSAYAVGYLFSKGYRKLYNLSGGYSGYYNKFIKMD